MSTRCRTCRALPRARGLLLLAAVAFANGCASGDVAEQPGDASSDAAAEESRSHEPRSVYSCSLALGLVRGSLEVFRDRDTTPTCRIAAPELPESSRIFCVGEPPLPSVCPDCYELRASLGCTLTLSTTSPDGGTGGAARP
jgi:hypothetical protein